MRVVVLILCDFQMASLDWRRSIWRHRNARIPFNCTKLINKLLFSTLPWSHPTQHVCACQTAAGPLSITVCHVPHCVIQSQCSFLKKSQYLTKTVPSTSPTASHTLPSFISPAVCVINSSAISLFFFFPNGGWERSGDLKLKLLGLPWWCSGYASASQGHWFDPWSSRILHAVEQRSPCTATTEARDLRACVPQQERAAQWETQAPQVRVALTAARESLGTALKTQCHQK